MQMFNKWILKTNQRTHTNTHKVTKRYQNIIGPHMYQMGWKPSLAQQVQLKSSKFQVLTIFRVIHWHQAATLSCYSAMWLHSIWGSCVRCDTPAVYWSSARQHKMGHQLDKRTNWEQPSKHRRADAKRKYIFWVQFLYSAQVHERLIGIKSSLDSCAVINVSESQTHGSTIRWDKKV